MAVSCKEFDGVGNTRLLLMQKCCLFQWILFLWQVDYAQEESVLTEREIFAAYLKLRGHDMNINFMRLLFMAWFALFWKVKLFNAAK